MKRRTLLLGGGAAVGAAGCVSRLLGDDDNADSNPSDSNNQDTTSSDNSTAQTNDTAPGNTSEQANSTSGNQNETRETKETNGTNETNQTEQERQPLPDENDTTIDRDQYNSSAEREVEELSGENVQLTATYNEQQDGSIIVSGQAENVTDQPIDFVDIRVLYYDANKNVIGEDLVVVNELAAGETKPWDCKTWASDINGDVAQVGGVPLPQNYA